jgi:hypothetical protein
MISAQLLKELRAAENNGLVSHAMGGDGNIYIRFMCERINSKKILAVQKYIETAYNYKTEVSSYDGHDGGLVVLADKYPNMTHIDSI